jgi:hypothetical protein
MDMFFEKQKFDALEPNPIKKKVLIGLGILILISFLWLFNYKRVNGRDIPKHFGALPIGGDHLHIFLIPFSHNDVGFDLTPEQYYNSTRHYHTTPPGAVQKTMESVIDAMLEDKRRKFAISQMFYFKMYWDAQGKDRKGKIKELIRQGQLEILGTGVTENDEATTYYEDVLENKFNAIKFAREQLDTIPKTGWQIDTHGHSSTEALLNSRLGYNSMIISKISYKDKYDNFMKNALQTLWRPNNLKDDQILTEVTPDHYCAPNFLSAKGVMNINNRINHYNVEKYADRFHSYVLENSKYYRSNFAMQLLGCDFSWTQADHEYKNIERMVRYMNSNTDRYANISMYFVTPSEYFSHLNRANVTFPIKIDDYLPYAEDEKSYFVGFYTSRPWEKLLVKELGRLYQKYKSFAARLFRSQDPIVRKDAQKVHSESMMIDDDFKSSRYDGYGRKVYPKIDQFSKPSKSDKNRILFVDYLNKTISELGWELGVANSQHAIGGTSKKFVQADFFSRMNNVKIKALKSFQKYFKFDLGNGLLKDIGTTYFRECKLADGYESACPSTDISNLESAVVSVYNPAAEREILVKIPVTGDFVQVIEANTNMPIQHDLIEYFEKDRRYKYLIVFKTKIGFKQFKYFMVRKHVERHNKIIKESPNVEGENWDFFWNLAVPVTTLVLKQEVPISDTTINPTRKVEISLGSKTPNQKTKAASEDSEDESDSEPKKSDQKDTVLIKVFKTYREWELDYTLTLNLEKYTDIAYIRQKSGAYIFVTPQNADSDLEPVNEFDTMTYVDSTYYTEIFIKGSAATLTLRIPKTEDYFYKPNPQTLQSKKNEFIFEIETKILPSLPTHHRNQEIVLKIAHSNIDNRQTFYTDANGLFMQKRILDYFYNSESEKRIESNYYPINTAIYVEDWFESPSEQEAGLRMTVLNDRTQGGASLRRGEIEIMLDRKTAFDDAQGVFEPLMDRVDPYGVEHKGGLEVVTTHRVIVDSKSSRQNLQRRIQFYDDLAPVVMVGKYEGSKFGESSKTVAPVRIFFLANEM